MEIIESPTVEQFTETIVLRNVVFSAFSGYEPLTPAGAYQKISESKYPTIFSINDNGNLVAFAIGYERHAGYYHLWQLGVAPQQRGKGLATKLYDEVEKYAAAKGFTGITLNTFNRFPSNIRLAVKRGYKIYDVDKSEEFKTDPKINFKLEF